MGALYLPSDAPNLLRIEGPHSFEVKGDIAVKSMTTSASFMQCLGVFESGGSEFAILAAHLLFTGVTAVPADKKKSISLIEPLPILLDGAAATFTFANVPCMCEVAGETYVTCVLRSDIVESQQPGFAYSTLPIFEIRYPTDMGTGLKQHIISCNAAFVAKITRY